MARYALLAFALFACCALVAFADRDDDDDDHGHGHKDRKNHPGPGALVKVTITSEVGVLLDDLPADTLSRAVQFVTRRPQKYWREAALKQITLARYRLIYRPYWYDFNEDGTPTRGQLPLPWEQFSFRFTSAPTRKTFQGHDVVSRSYIAEAFIVTDNTTILISDPQFAMDASRTVNEDFVFPLDPYLLFQRTAYDCMNEGGYPLESIDGENVDYTYDDSCGPLPPFDPSQGACQQCHCTGFSTLSCVDSLHANIGAVNTNINFQRIPWDERLAREVEDLSLYEITNPTGADVTPNFEALQHNFLGYRFFTQDSCVNTECGGVPGWRRILYFDASNVNVGGINMEIGKVDFAKADPNSFDPDVYHNLFYWDACHQHPHFFGYAAYQYGSNQGRKQGFCIQTTGREINARWTPITTKSYTCNYQAVDSGWSDAYQAGIPCQWVDVTSVNTRTRTATQALTITSNPLNWICEGVIQNNPDGSRQWVPTGQTTASGQSIDKFNCTQTPNAAANNARSVMVTLPTDGNGLLTSPCKPSGHALGPKRDCDFSIRTQLDRCTPGSTVNLVCSIRNDKPSQVLRVCESSLALRSGLACRMHEPQTLANVVLRPGVNTPVTFTCPSARDSIETGGAYSTYSGPAFNGGDNFANVRCNLA